MSPRPRVTPTKNGGEQHVTGVRGAHYSVGDGLAGTVGRCSPVGYFRGGSIKGEPRLAVALGGHGGRGGFMKVKRRRFGPEDGSS